MSAPPSPAAVARRLFRLSVGMFFIGGYLSATVSLFVPRMTLLYHLGFTRALLIQFAFHLSYLLFALPIATVIMRLGYMRALVIGLSVMAASCALFVGAQGLHNYALVLVALLALSGGLTFLQIGSNTVVAVVGNAAGAAFRLNLLQAFNSIGTVVGPLLGATFVLDQTEPVTGLAAVRSIVPPFAFAILVLSALAVLFGHARDLLAHAPRAQTDGVFRWARVLRHRRLLGGATAIFVYVGAEVGLGTLLTNYLVLPDVLGIAPIAAGRLVSLYWAGAMIGRFAGAAAMRRIRPAVLLMLAAGVAVTLVAIASLVQGPVGAAALLGVGLCNSIMYPTIYVLALPPDPAEATPAGTVLCMAVVGAAIIPLLTGMLADRVGLATSFALPALCYVVIAGFARSCCGEEAGC
jgi:MFS transporter, FHS family, L-fucose permease